MLHKYSTPSNNHILHSWDVADEAALLAIAGLVEADEGRVALRRDTNSLWLLVDYSVPTWVPTVGEPGPQGLSAYEVAVAEGFVGDEAAWLLSLKGDTGDTGPAGADGTDGVDGADGTVITVSDTAPGSPAVGDLWLDIS